MFTIALKRVLVDLKKSCAKKVSKKINVIICKSINKHVERIKKKIKQGKIKEARDMASRLILDVLVLRLAIKEYVAIKEKNAKAEKLILKIIRKTNTLGKAGNCIEPLKVKNS